MTKKKPTYNELIDQISILGKISIIIAIGLFFMLALCGYTAIRKVNCEKENEQLREQIPVWTLSYTCLVNEKNVVRMISVQENYTSYNEYKYWYNYYNEYKRGVFQV